ncbi:hypothetical protein MYAER_3677 [Microcystis aeruginosa NIES-2549]|uniref:Uncharacterized protein n=1 Tax=Microcystis aeruginosa NIES-2549 TaxID=1641812 RepID=A0A0F6RNB2_MICAE|nr:hypothetical protein MYAER_3677 [Microcystis aeruginosa NIES-2549]
MLLNKSKPCWVRLLDFWEIKKYPPLEGSGGNFRDFFPEN